MKDVLLAALLGLPFVIPLSALAYSLLCLLLRRFRRITRAGCVLTLMVLGAGILYGALRFSGIILFPQDNSWSANWFGDSWKDDGFRYVYSCGISVVVILAALHAEKKYPMTKE